MFNLLFKLKNFIQRGKRGVSDADAWDFDYYHARLISRALNMLIENQEKIPLDMSREEWVNILRKIRYGFDLYVYTEEEPSDAVAIEKANRAVARSCKLLGEYYEYLWY